MQPNVTSNAELIHLTEVMNTLTEIQLRMARVKDTFPNYYKQLLQAYNRILLQAKSANDVPPWMKM